MVAVLRKKLLVFGIALIFISVVFVSCSRVPNEKVWNDPVTKGNNVWELTAFFNSGDIMVVYFEPAKNCSKLNDNWWYLFVRSPDPEHRENLNFTIIGPSGKSVFNVSLGGPRPSWGITPDPTTGEVPVIIYSIELISQEDSDLEIRNPPEIGGIVKKSGNYTVRIEPNVYWDRDKTINTTWPKVPPQELIFFREVHEKVYPYSYLLPIGASLSVMGITVSFFGAKNKGRRRRWS